MATVAEIHIDENDEITQVIYNGKPAVRKTLDEGLHFTSIDNMSHITMFSGVCPDCPKGTKCKCIVWNGNIYCYCR